MSRHELDAAGIREPMLRSSYEACRRINASHGRTFYLATALLPAAKRPAVHALYGFARHADDIVQKWIDYFVLHRRVQPEVITLRIR